jgi:2-keto-3-deoxy-galactonokinase
MSPAQRALIAEKRAAYEQRSKKNLEISPGLGVMADTVMERGEDIEITGDGASFPPSATMCFKCNTQAVVIMDGCATCLNCGYSKCG